MKEVLLANSWQPVLEACSVEARHGLAAEDIEAGRCDNLPIGIDIAAGGAFGPKDRR